MSTKSTCPNTEQLAALIGDELSGEQQKAVTAHLDGCQDCQQRIQNVANGDKDLDSLILNIDDIQPPRDSAFWTKLETATWPAVDRSTGVEPRNRNENHGPSGNGKALNGSLSVLAAGLADVKVTELDFLEETNDQEYIGRLEKFLIKRVIGQGGMGIVLEAFDPQLHRSVAIKVLRAQFQENDIARQRFCREGRAAAAITHEHIVAMHYVSEAQDGKTAFLVMQLIDGQTLESLLEDKGGLAPAEVARIGMQIASGLAASHSRGMVHRDIKPANILLELETGRVKLTDFGLARVKEQVKLTTTGMVAGTPLYMSPEQAVGGEPDERSDLFALGAVMYEMATGVSAFQAPSVVGVMKKVMDESPESPDKLNTGISKPLSSLILRLLEKDPDDRPDSAAAVALVLADILAGYEPRSPLETPAVTASQISRLSNKHRVAVNRNWMVATAIASALAIAGISVAATLWFAGTRIAYVDRGTSGVTIPSIEMQGEPGVVWTADFLSDDRAVSGLDQGKIVVWKIENQKIIHSFDAHRGIIWDVRYSPDANLVASGGDDGMVKLWDATTFEPELELTSGNSVRGLAFSPDGKRLVVGNRDGLLQIFDVETGKVIKETDLPSAIFAVEISADGKWIAAGGSDRIVRVLDAATLEIRQSLTGHKGPIYGLAFSSTRPLLASVGWNHELYIWNVETGQQTMSIPNQSGDIWGVAFCDASNHLITASQDGTGKIWNLADGRLKATLVGHENGIHDLRLDPTSRRRILTSSRDGTVRVWDISKLNSSVLQ